MKIIENELLVRFNEDKTQLEIYQLTDDASVKVIMTAYPCDDMLSKGISEMGKIIGEDILLMLPSTRRLLLQDDT